MRICFLSLYPFDEHAGGVDRVCCILVREFEKRGYKVFYVHKRPAEKCSDAQKYDDFAHFDFPEDNIWKENSISFFKDFAQQNKFDIVIDVSNSERMHEIAYISRDSCGYNLISCSHSNPEIGVKSKIDELDEILFSQSGVSKFLKWVRLLLAYPIGYTVRKKYLISKFVKEVKESDAYVLLCDGYADYVRGLVETTQRNKICSINNPLDLKDDSSLCTKENTVLFVGRLEFQKRVDRLLRIWSRVEKKAPLWKLVIVGDGSTLGAYKSYCEKLHLQHVQFVGAAIGTQYMKRSKIITMQSTHEGFPMVLLEGMYYRNVPVLFDSFKAAEDIVTHNENGFLIKPFDEKMFAKTLLSLMNDESKMINMQENAFQSSRRYDVDKIVDKWEFIFHSL